LSHLRDIGIPVAIGILTFIGLLLAPGSFLIHPVFEIEVTNPSRAEYPSAFNEIKITNTGWVQAKNVRINIVPTTTGYTHVTCPEYSRSEILLEIVRYFELDRMSVNLPCHMIAHRSDSIDTVQITVTADDSPAYIWKLKEQTTESLSSEVYEFLTISIPLLIGITASIIAFWVNRRMLKRVS